ncbi:MAG: bacteriohemerythrin [Gammaproteobacteria bacterium]|nr:bacteriohemerythrin [Gammaproteobacteria bacterium]MBU1656039.1 bacteriohemerythrin [Gammaproteobacteria bacterium]MBU1962247.1 bacteriohemerythrin [Gammaproteobacteria bacterium]
MELQTQAPRQQKKLLIVDDGLDNLLILSARLRDRYQLLTAENGKRALDLATQDPRPDLILLDIMMPGMDGYEVCRRLKADRRTQDIPIIFLTALSESDDEAQGFSLGAADYVTKPFASQSLNARIERQLTLSNYLQNVQQELYRAEQAVVAEASVRSRSEEVREQLEQGKEAMLGLARTAFLATGFKNQMEAALDQVLSIPYLSGPSRGAIFLTNNKGELSLIAQRNFSQDQRKACSRIPLGHGLCGQAAKRRQPLFIPGMALCDQCLNDQPSPGGAYCLPLQDASLLLGVLLVYLPEGHVQSEGELEVMKELRDILASVVGRRMAEERIRLKQVELNHSRTDTIHRLALASEYRDAETGMHILRMSKFAALIAASAGLDQATCELVEQAAPMHDLGKIGIADDILLKPAPLSYDEFERMKKHTIIGARMLENGDALMRMARDIALSHHERWDGRGYPHGLAGEEIPLAARICAISDVFDALISERPYKRGWPVEQAIDYVREHGGSYFDPNLVTAFNDALTDILKIRARYQDNTINPRERLPLDISSMESSDLIPWNPGYSVGIDIIDEHHRHLLHWISRLHHSLRKEKGTIEIGKALYALDRYCRIHFAAEERMMEAYGYRDLEAHARMHRAFERKLVGFKRELMHNPLILGIEVVEFLREWLLNHIYTVDAGIAIRITLSNIPPHRLH